MKHLVALYVIFKETWTVILKHYVVVCMAWFVLTIGLMGAFELTGIMSLIIGGIIEFMCLFGYQYIYGDY